MKPKTRPESVAGAAGRPDRTLEEIAYPARLQTVYNGLTGSERKAAAYFSANLRAAYLSINDVVADSGLGYGTIMRFCRKLGCAGFQDFKVLLAREMGNGSRAAPAGGRDWIAQYGSKIQTELAETAKLIDRRLVRNVAEALNRADRVLVAGIAGSEATAIAFDYRLSRLGIRSQAVCEGYTLCIRAACLAPGDVLVAVSFSGATKDILAAARIARERGATVVSLTNFVHAPLVELAHFSLLSATDHDPLSCEVFSIVSSNFVLDVVFSELFRRRKNAKDVVDRTYKAIADRRV